MGLICSVALKRPTYKEQHLCADKAYDSDDFREFVASAGYVAHIKVNPRRKRPLKASSIRPMMRPQRGFTRRGDG
jgi:hypothetical protein